MTAFAPSLARRIPAAAALACLRLDILPSPFILAVSVDTQRMRLFRRSLVQTDARRFPRCNFVREFLISTSRFGTGQAANSNRTPLGLHRIAEKIGGGFPSGTIFRGRKPAGLTWNGGTGAAVVHRILWLDGVEPGVNRGGNVDSRSRFIYIHGCADETTLGRPASRGCIHLGAADLIPLFDQVPAGTLVWIE